MLTHFSGKVSPCGLKMTAVASINFQLLRMKKAIPSVSYRSPENIADGLGEVIYAFCTSLWWTDYGHVLYI